jgi:tetratricopeptide (TPR) repeat protein
MTMSTRETLTNLDRLIEELRAEGKLVEAAGALGQQGLIYATMQKWAESAEAFEQAAQLAVEVGEIGGEAMARYGQGMALFHLPERQEEARQVFEQAAALAEESDYHVLAAKAHYILHSFRLDAGDMPGAMTELTAGIDRLDAESEPRLALQMLQTRSSMNFLDFQFDRARSDLDQALAVAQRIGDERSTLGIRLDQQVLKSFSAGDDGGSPDGLFKSLLARARQTGNRQIIGEVKLQQAISLLETGRFKQALKRAQEAREITLQSADHGRYMRYLVACLLIAQAQERLENRPEVLATLLTCKKTFEGALGKEAGQIVVPFLDALHYRWGPEILQEALHTYQQHMQTQQAG